MLSLAEFAAACLPAATNDNLLARVDIADRFLTDLETVLRQGGATEGELIAEFLENLAKSTKCPDAIRFFH